MTAVADLPDASDPEADAAWWAEILASEPTGPETNGHKPAGDTDAGESIDTRYPMLDWAQVWTDTPGTCDWLVEPLFEHGRIYAIYAPAKAGKSLLLQEIAAGLATGRSVLGNEPTEPVNVLYVDLENSIADIVERMAAYGYGPGDLDNLKYMSFPNLPTLDSARGGADLLAVAVRHNARFVVIDTVSRIIGGGENDSDTFHALYRHCMGPLKALGITTARLDHEGKDSAKGQRGSSAKATDADTVWRLETAGPTGRVLVRMASRTTHHPERVSLTQRFEPLRHELGSDGTGHEVPALDAVADMVALLERLDVPRDWGRDRVGKLLVGSGFKVRTATLTASLRIYKGQLGEPE